MPAQWNIAFDADGNYYIADSPANRIRRVGPEGIIQTAAQVIQPQSLVSDGRGALIIASQDGGPLRRLNLATGTLDSVRNAQGRYATVDTSGNILFVNRLQVYRLEAHTGEVTLVAGRSGPPGYSGDGGPAREASLDDPQRLLVGVEGLLYIADCRNDRIRRVGQDGHITTVAGSDQSVGDGVPAEQAVIYDALGISVDSRGDIYFPDNGNFRVRRLRSLRP